MLQITFQLLALLALQLLCVTRAAPAPSRPPLAVLLSAAEHGQPGAADALQERIGTLKKDSMTPAGIAAVERTMAISGERTMRAATQVGRSAAEGVVDDKVGDEDEMQVVLAAPPPPKPPVRVLRPNRPNIRLMKKLNFTGSGLPGPVTPRKERTVISIFNPKADISPTMPRIGTTKFFASIRRANDAIGQSLTSLRIQGGDEADDGPTLFTPDPVVWAPLRHDEGRQIGYWSIPFDSLRVNGHYIEGAEGEAGIFDPSSYRLALSPLVAGRVYKWVEGSFPIHAAGTGGSAISYSYPCSAHISVSLEFARREHTISTSKFSITPLATEQVDAPMCLGAVYGLKMLNNGPRAEKAEDLS